MGPRAGFLEGVFTAQDRCFLASMIGLRASGRLCMI